MARPTDPWAPQGPPARLRRSDAAGHVPEAPLQAEPGPSGGAEGSSEAAAPTEPPHRRRASALAALLGDENPTVWEAAHEALLEAARAARPELKRAARGPEPLARVRARGLLRRLDQRRTLRALIRGLGAREVDLEAGLWRLAAFEHPGLDPRPGLARLDELAERVRERLDEAPHGYERAMVLPSVLGGEAGLGGRIEDYHHPRHASIAHALDRGEGLPLTLVGIYLAVARRAGLEAHGVGLPGHMLLRLPFGERSVLVDTFHHGAVRTRKEVTAMLLGQGHAPHPKWFANSPAGGLLARQFANFDLALAQAGRNADRHEFRLALRAAVRHGWLRPPRTPRTS